MEQLLSTLRELGIKVKNINEELRVESPPGALTEEAKKSLLLHKNALLDLLRNQDHEKPQEINVLTPDNAHRYEPFVLTELQQAYWVNRISKKHPDEIFDYFYIELHCQNIDLAKVETALQKTIHRHDMLRMLIDADGKPRILESPPALKIPVHFCQDVAEEISKDSIPAGVLTVRNSMKSIHAQAETWPLFDIQASKLSDNDFILHVRLEYIALDGFSILLFFRDWGDFYLNPSINKSPIDISYRDYIIELERSKKSASSTKSEKYWTARIANLPPTPALPLKNRKDLDFKPNYQRRERRFDKSIWIQIKDHAKAQGATASSLILTAYAEVLARWSASKHFTINITTGIRHPWHPDIAGVIGEFTEIILYEVDRRNPGITFKDFAKQCQDQLFADQSHSDYSGLKTMRQWVKHHHSEPMSIMPVVFSSGLGWSEQEKNLGRLDRFGETIFSINRTSNVWLDAQVFQIENELVLIWDSVDNAFEPGVLDAMFSAQIQLIQDLASNPHIWNAKEIISLPVQMSAHRIPMPAIKPPAPQHLHAALIRYAQAHPEPVAVISKKRTLTFGELLGEAAAVASYLISHEIQSGEPVAVLMHKGWEQIVAVLGILWAGGAYVPIDADLPLLRQQEIVKICGVKQIITQEFIDIKAWDCINIYQVVQGHQSAHTQQLDLSFLNPLNQVCYVIFTSGTTGIPKGVTISHESAWNTVGAINELFDVNETDCILGISSLSFDLSVYDIFGVLGVGGKIVIPSQVNDPEEWAQLIVDHHVSIWNSVPQFLQILATSPQTSKDIYFSLKSVLLSGDFIPVELPSILQEKGCIARIESLGGATEASVWSIHFPIQKIDSSWQSIPYGKALPGQAMMVLDAHLQETPDFTRGSIYIGGKGLAMNYWSEPALTEDRFITHPVTRQRIYNTGDLGFYDSNGDIIIQGRVDGQIKIRGYRVELGEVESALRKYSAVEQAVVVDVVLHPSGNRQIAAFITITKLDKYFSNEDLNEHLNHLLPPYMIPSYIKILDRLPLTPNGKCDLKALREMVVMGLPINSHVEPQNTYESTIYKLWSKILKIEKFSVTDEFVHLGGDSVAAMILLGQLREVFQQKISINDIFSSKTVRSLSRLLQDRDIIGSADSTDAPRKLKVIHANQMPSKASQVCALSDMQVGFYMADQSGMDFHVRPHTYIERDFNELDVDKYILAWNIFFKRRASQLVVAQPSADLAPVLNFNGLDFVINDLRGLSTLDAFDALNQTRTSMMRSELPIYDWPWLDLRISIWSNEGRIKHRLHYNNNNFFIDAYLVHIILAEVSDLYQKGGDLEGAPEFKFFESVNWIKKIESSSEGQADKDYWLNRLPRLPDAPKIPSKVNINRRTRSSLNRREGFLSLLQWNNLKDFSRIFGVTPTSFLFAAYSKILSFWSDKEHFLLANMMTRRLLLPSEMRGTMGNFASIYPLEVNMKEQDEFQAFVKDLQEQNLNDAEHLAFGGMRVMQAINQLKNTLGTATIPFVISSALFMSKFERPDFTCLETSQVLVDHQFWEIKDGRMYYVWDVQEEFFPAGLLDDMWDAYGRLLEHLARDVENWKARDFDLLPQWQKDERRQWPVDKGSLPAERLGDLLPRAVAQFAHADAVVGGARHLDQAGLARGAGAVRQALLQLRLQAGDRVAVVMERGVYALMAVHGVLLAGAAYVPMDAGLPIQRVRQIVQDCGAKVVLCLRANADQWGSSVQALAVDDLPAWDGDLSALHAPDEVAPNNLAYIIYTSGSTGVPKGVMIDHLGAMNTVRAVNRRFGVGSSDRLLGVSSLGFDLSVYDIFGAADAGACLVYPDPEQTLNPAHWLELLAKESITIWNSAPALAVLMCEAAELRGAQLPELRLVMLSGDWIPLDLPQRIHRIASNARVVSLGGATEASIWSIWHTVDEVDPAWRSIPYGRAMDNQHWYVLNDRLQDVPVWVEGDLYIGGVGLAQGYWGDAEKTEAAFIMRNGERLYRTGDRGRFVPGGLIEFLGRKDAQVKIQGHRIELGEIESALALHPAVSAAVVVVQHRAAALADTAPGPDSAQSAELAAHVVLQPGQTVDVHALTGFLSDKLPGYMVPRLLGFLPALPLTSNGKLDRKTLPVLGADAVLVAAKVSRPPRDETESQLLALWSQVLEHEVTTVGSDFFELGGQSFAAVRLVGLIKEAFGTRLSLADVWQNRDVESLAALVRSPTLMQMIETPILRLLANPDLHSGAAPLVLVHPAGGHVLGYRHVAALLHRPVWAFEAPSEERAAALELYTVEAIAAYYAAQLKDVSLQGSLWIGGWSSGGPVAVEMAAQLQRSGRLVQGVLVVDSPAPAAHWSDQMDRRALLSWFAEDLALDAAAITLAQNLKVDGLDHTAQLSAYQAALSTIGSRLPLGISELVPVYQTFERMVRATRKYRPCKLDLPMLVLRARDGHVTEFGDHPAQSDVSWGWQTHGPSGQVTAVWVDGTHHTVLLEPHVVACAQAIEAWTEAVVTDASLVK
jgi:yersiniabactin nonribosomal peptide synthetase